MVNRTGRLKAIVTANTNRLLTTPSVVCLLLFNQPIFSGVYGGAVVRCWTCDQQVAGSNPSRPAVECNCGQVVNTHVPLSPSSIIWYQPTGGDAWRLGR